MLRNFRRLLVASVAALSLIGGPDLALAQGHPFQNPTYIPTAVLGPVTCAAACDVTFTTGGETSVLVRLAGSATGIAAQIQGSEQVGSSAVWSNLVAHPVAGSATAPADQATISGNGLWRVNTAGMAQVRLHLTALTGSETVTMAGSVGASFIEGGQPRKQTYSASISGLSPAASATDFLSLTGSATATVKVTHVECSGVSTAASVATVNAVVRSTANTGGTSASMTAVPHDSFDAAASATALDYTANPGALGTLVGIVRAGKLSLGIAASSTQDALPLSWDFGSQYDGRQELVLRGITQVFALNAAGASFAAGASLNCSVEWEEE